MGTRKAQRLKEARLRMEMGREQQVNSLRDYVEHPVLGTLCSVELCWN